MRTRTRAGLLAAVALFVSTHIVFAQDLQKQINLKNALSEGRLKSAGDTSLKKIELGINLNQGSFSSNWTGGGVNSVALGLFFNVLSVKQSGKNAWRTDFQSQYGVVRNKGQKSRKSADRLFYDFKYNRELISKWSLFGNFNVLSQFSAGFEYSDHADSVDYRKKVSGFFAPAYITEAIGIEYRPVSYFFIDLAPGALRQTIVADRNLYLTMPKNYGVEAGRSLRNEVGIIQVVANFDKDIALDVRLKFRYLLYTSFAKNQVSGVREFAGDHRLDATITARIARYFNVNLGAIVIYDKDQSNKVQFAQGLSVGFLYTFK
jgi:hypothetical protein